MPYFKKNLNKIAKDTDKCLKYFFSKLSSDAHLANPMKYSLFSGGKKFRSAIIVNTGKIFNLDYKTLITIAAAVECVHSYSLIHDDLPSMDDDDFRRGKLSSHKKFNEYTAILAGNSLLTLAFEILSSDALKLTNKVKKELIKSLSNCAGVSGLAEGQYLDLTYENKKISFQKIIDLQKKKTGKLFGFCCEVASIIKELNRKDRETFKKIGIEIGLLFQIIDDLIDYTGDIKKVGKATKKDQKKGKATLINLLGYNDSVQFAQYQKKKIDNKIKKYGIKARDLSECVNFILEREY